MALTTKEGQGKGGGKLININVWEAISNDMGEVTDVSLTHYEGYSTINYKSNGIDKKISIGGNNIRPMIQSFLYYFEALTHAPKQYQAFY
jgi:hypothetical protein